MTIKLTERQIPHVKKLSRDMSRGHVVLDMSETGTGKTITTAWIAKKDFTHVILICPASTIESAKRKMALVNVVPDYIMSYEKLRGSAKLEIHSVAMGLLDRSDRNTMIRTPDGKINQRLVTYTPTQTFLDLLKEKVNTKYNTLLVFDEVQKLKNINDTVFASRALIDEIIETKNSRVMLLSATAMDKEEQYPYFFSLIRVNTSNRLYRMDKEGNLHLFNREGKSYGFKQIYDFSMSIDKVATKKLIPDIENVRIFQINSLIKGLFHNVFKPNFASAMNGPLAETTHTYYMMDSLNATLLKQHIIALQKIFGYDQKVGVLNIPQIKKNVSVYSKINDIFENIEKTKIPIFTRLAIETLEKNNNFKVVLCLNYKDNIKKLSYLLQDYFPLTTDSDVSLKKREEIYKKFQEHNSESRLLICSVKTSGTGIDLHDTSPGGKYQRHVFASADYSYIASHQLLGRFWREGFTSEPVIKFVFGMTGQTPTDTIRESRLINALARKQKVVMELRDLAFRVETIDDEYQEKYNLEIPREEFESQYQFIYKLDF